MKRVLSVIFLAGTFVAAVRAQTPMFQEGTVTRMRTISCALASSRLVSVLSGAPQAPNKQPCAEYTLVTDNVVYIVVGKPSNPLIPLGEKIKFRLRKNEVVIRVDDANRDSNYLVHEMMLRADWERERIAREQKDSAKTRMDVILSRPED